MGVNSIRADKLSGIVPRILNKKEALISERFLRLCSNSLIFLSYFFVKKIPLSRRVGVCYGQVNG